jgi:hypothetical protein
MTRRILLALACVCTVVFTTAAPQAQAVDPIRYTLRFPAPHTHYVEVEAAIPTSGRAEVEVYMATWTPGSYLIREYERNVEAVTATAGSRALSVAKSTKNRWKIATGSADLHHPGRTCRASARSSHRTAGILEKGRDRTRAGERIAEHIPRRRLRHHRRQPDHHR